MVEAPARLHLGFLDPGGRLGRTFGSLGLTIEGFATRIRLERAAVPEVAGEDELLRARAVLETLAAGGPVPSVRLTVESAIPAHAGLGSGTQLGLAIGVGLARLGGARTTPGDVARRLARGARSGIGLGAFMTGGFIVDGGKGRDDAPPPVIARLPFPADWRVLLILDRARRGLSGASEHAAFRQLAPFPAEAAGRLCRLTLMRLLPGLATADLEAVGAAVGEVQRTVGEHFAAVQGGRYTSPAVAEVLAWLEAQDVAGVGQSSWGPTGFALMSAEQARSLAASARARAGVGSGLSFAVAGGRNHGARIEMAPADRRGDTHQPQIIGEAQA